MSGRNRRHGSVAQRWLSYVGDCKALDTYLESKSGPAWWAPKFINSLLRGYAQVLFANHPISGVLLLLALFWVDWVVGLAALIGAALTIITAVLMKQNAGAIQAGLFTYNGLLVGCVTASLWTPIYGEPLSVKLWAFIVVGSILSVFVTAGCGKLLSVLSLPALTLPFNLVNIILFVCLMPPVPLPTPPPTTSVSLHDPGLAAPNLTTMSTTTTVRPINGEQPSSLITDNALDTLNKSLSTGAGTSPEHDEVRRDSDADDDSINWGKVCIGVILSMGQVFAVENVFGSILMYTAVAVYSPLLFIMSVLGAAAGTFAGLLFTVAPDYEVVYAGICGYNSLLAASASGFFYPLTLHSSVTGLGNVAFTVLLQQFFAVAFRGLRLPFFTLPFVFSTFVFLSITSSGDQLQRVVNISFPEMHRYEYSHRSRNTRTERSHLSTSPESKELV